MILSSTSHFDRRLAKKINKNHQLKNNVGKQLKLLRENAMHLSLKLHKLKGKRVNEFAITIDSNVKITFQIIKNNILLTDIITHDEY